MNYTRQNCGSNLNEKEIVKNGHYGFRFNLCHMKLKYVCAAEN